MELVIALLKDQEVSDGLLYHRAEEDSVGVVNVLFVRLNGAATRVVLELVDDSVATGFAIKLTSAGLLPGAAAVSLTNDC